MPFTIFISHGPGDIDVVRFIASQLQLGGQRPLIAHEDRPLKAARSLPKIVRERILESGCVLALISNQGSQSDLVRQEVEFASRQKADHPHRARIGFRVRIGFPAGRANHSLFQPGSSIRLWKG